MAVVTIDSKGELEQIRSDLDVAQALQDGKIPESKASPADEAAAKPSGEGASTEDAEEAEGEDGLTSRERHDLLAVGRKELPDSVKRVIGKRVAQRKAAEEFAAAQYSERKLAESRLAATERELADLKAKAKQPEEAAKPDAGKPQRDKFPAGAEGDTAYWEAVIDWRADLRADAKLREKETERAAEEEQQRINEMLSIARQKSALVPDFADALRQATELDLRIPPIIHDYMLQTEMGAELSYHLAKNPKVVESLWKLKPSQQLVTIGKIESTLKPFEAKKPATKDEDGATPSSKASTNGTRREAAPSEDETGIVPGRARDTAPVIRPLNGSGASPAEVAPADMNIRETIRDYERRNHANLALRKRH
jgi:hypothetical protein